MNGLASPKPPQPSAAGAFAKRAAPSRVLDRAKHIAPDLSRRFARLLSEVGVTDVSLATETQARRQDVAEWRDARSLQLPRLDHCALMSDERYQHTIQMVNALRAENGGTVFRLIVAGDERSPDRDARIQELAASAANASAAVQQICAVIAQLHRPRKM